MAALGAMVFAAWVGLGETARAQCSDRWLAGDVPLGVNYTPNYVVSWDPDGAGPRSPVLVVSGDFSFAGTTPVPFIAMWDGQAWQPMEGPPWTGGPRPLVLNGGLYAFASNRPSSQVLRWNGTTWESMGGTFAQLNDGVVYRGDILVAGGYRPSGSGTPISYLSRWDGQDWIPFAGDMNVSPNFLGVVGNDLFALGAFTIAGGVPVDRLARWDGAAWTAMGSLPDRLGRLYVHGNGVYADGYDSLARSSYLRRWTGATWLPVVQPDLYEIEGKKIVGSNWYAWGSQYVQLMPRSAMLRWNGSQWEDTAYSGTGFSAFDLAEHRGSLHLVGSTLTSGRVARWGGAGWLPLEPFTPGHVRGGSGNVANHNGELWAVGGFSVPGDASAAVLARRVGNEWAPFRQLTGYPYSILSTGIDLYIGGTILRMGTASFSAVARWNGTSLSLLPEPGTTVYDMVQHRGELIIAGWTGNERIVSRWNGVVWEYLGYDLVSRYRGTNDHINALIVYRDRVILGGQLGLPSTGGVPRALVLQLIGTSWEPLGSGLSGSYGVVNALTLYRGDLIAAGNFTSADGQPVRHIARWDGVRWHAMGDFDRSVECLKVYGGALIAGGEFHTVDGRACERIARWDGRSWTPMGAGLRGGRYSSGAYSLGVHRGELFVGGAFLFAGDQISAGFARWRACLADLDDGTGTGVCDGGVSIDDLLYFLDAYARGDWVADLDDGSGWGASDGAVTIDDLLFFLRAYDVGC